MNVAKLRHEIERDAIGATWAMANESMSDREEPLAASAHFHDSDDVVSLRIHDGGPIPGHLNWSTGARTPFTATYRHHRLNIEIGPWELPGDATKPQ